MRGYERPSLTLDVRNNRVTFDLVDGDVVITFSTPGETRLWSQRLTSEHVDALVDYLAPMLTRSERRYWLFDVDGGEVLISGGESGSERYLIPDAIAETVARAGGGIEITLAEARRRGAA